MRRILAIAAVWAAAVSPAGAEFDPFAAAVIDNSLNAPNPPIYLPAPGQLINQGQYNDAAKAMGAPVGAGTGAGNNSSVVTLGGFGGQLILAFNHDVLDSPANPFGLDAIVFGNAYYVEGNPQLHWSEQATIEIMPELGGDAIPGNNPGEKWYVIPGSHLADASHYRTKTWTRGLSPNYPGFAGWPDSYQTSAHELSPNYQTINGKVGVLVNPGGGGQEGYWGYAEYTPTLLLGDRNGDNGAGAGYCPNMPAKLFYTAPDDPHTVGVTKGAGGGDAFDIQWAVDPGTWQPAGLRSFRYIRLTTAVDRVLPAVGEISAEIDAVADVRPLGDLDGDDKVNLDDYGLLLAAWGSRWGEGNFNPAADLVVDNVVDSGDYNQFVQGWTQYCSDSGAMMAVPPMPVPEPTGLLPLALMRAWGRPIRRRAR